MVARHRARCPYYPNLKPKYRGVPLSRPVVDKQTSLYIHILSMGSIYVYILNMYNIYIYIYIYTCMYVNTHVRT